MGKAIETAGPRRRKVWRWIFGILAVPLGFAALYWLAVLALSRIPVNADFRNSPGGVPIIVMDNGIHVDFLLPIVAEGQDWREVFDPAATRRGAPL
jgi:hypothetical protein